ncbi:hypothetical protein LLG46_11515 [bacterium]|nr:hypothetical protein [bacterium]
MRYTRYFFVVIALVLGFGAHLYAADEAQKVVVNTNIVSGTQRIYDVVLTVKGATETVLTMKIRHRYIDRSDDGVMLMEASLEHGTLRSGGQELFVSPSIYPKLTIMLDPGYHIKDIFGSISTGEQSNASCINYSNMIVLFYLPDGDKWHTVGESWESSVSLPTAGETFNIVNTLKGVETVGAENIAVVDQKISRVSAHSSAVSVESRFRCGDGKLLESHVLCAVPDVVDSKSISQVTMDITQSK